MSAVNIPVRESPERDRGALAKMLIVLFEHWHLSTEEQLDALGLAADNRAALTRYRKGAPIANNRDSLERADHLLRIHKDLRLMFPQNRDLAYQWMKRSNRAFDNLAPIDLIRIHGFAGLLMVRNYLDQTRGHTG